MKIIALSDSHAASLESLPPQLRTALRESAVIVHAGDHTEASLLMELQQTGRVVAVAGNMDSTAVKIRLPHRQIFTANGKTIGVTHGSGAPTGIAHRVRAEFPEKPDVIVFGHSHVPFLGVIDDVLMVNPGPAASGYATITINDEIAVELIST
jgi:uncharacterized protein